MPDNKARRNPADIARDWNHWIKYEDIWYSPDDFEQWLTEHPNEYNKEKSRFLNPYRELRNGLQIIERMITERQDPAQVAEMLKRACSFAEKIENARFTPLDPPGIKQAFAD